ncbi:hypothetical protein CsatB_020122 [Cannabis sativa]
MKAESRHRRQHTIRAKWLCDSSSSAGGSSSSQGGGGLREQDSNVNDQSMEEDQELIRNGKGKIIVDSEIMGGVNVISSNIYMASDGDNLMDISPCNTRGQTEANEKEIN